MKKKLLILFSLFFLTGCSVEYRLSIDDSIRETLDLEFSSNEITEDYQEYYDYLTGDNTYVYDDETILYEKTIEENGNNTHIVITTDHEFEKFKESKMISKCFSNTIFINDEDYYYINIDSPNMCSDGDDIKFIIETNKKVIQENATSSRNGKYTWVIGKDDTSVNILFQVSKTVSGNYINSSAWITVLVILVILVVLFLIGRRVWKKNNE